MSSKLLQLIIGDIRWPMVPRDRKLTVSVSVSIQMSQPPFENLMGRRSTDLVASSSHKNTHKSIFQWMSLRTPLLSERPC
jgi:hypothetical protein